MSEKEKKNKKTGPEDLCPFYVNLRKQGVFDWILNDFDVVERSYIEGFVNHYSRTLMANTEEYRKIMNDPIRKKQFEDFLKSKKPSKNPTDNK